MVSEQGTRTERALKNQHIPFVLIAGFAFCLLASVSWAQSYQVRETHSELENKIRAASISEEDASLQLLLTTDGDVINTSTNKSLASHTLNKFQKVEIVGGRYIVRSISTDTVNFRESGQIRWCIFDESGDQIQEIQHSVQFDQPLPTLWHSSDATQFVLTDPWGKTLIWYSESQKLATVNLSGIDTPEPYETAFLADWSKDNSNIIVGFALTNHAEKAPVLLFDADGNQRWRRTYPVEFLDGVIAAGDNQHFIVVGHDIDNGTFTKKYFIVNSDGDVVQQGTGIATGAAIRESGQAVVWGRRFVHFYGDVTKNPVWMKDFSDDKRSLCLGAQFLSKDIIGLLRGTSTPQNGDYVFTSPRLRLYSTAAGKEIWRRSYPGEIIYSPELIIGTGTNEIIFSTDSRLHRVQVQP